MPREEHTIKICMGSSCFSRGNGLNAEFLQKALEDGQVDASIDCTHCWHIEGSLCEGLCKDGPIIVIDGQVHRKVTLTTLQDILGLKSRG